MTLGATGKSSDGFIHEMLHLKEKRVSPILLIPKRRSIVDNRMKVDEKARSERRADFLVGRVMTVTTSKRSSSAFGETLERVNRFNEG